MINLPEAKPWQAMSKKGNSFFSLMTFDISAHCSGFGSTPVGLCAHACKRIIERSGIFQSKITFLFFRSEFFRPLVHFIFNYLQRYLATRRGNQSHTFSGRNIGIVSHLDRRVWPEVHGFPMSEWACTNLCLLGRKQPKKMFQSSRNRCQKCLALWHSSQIIMGLFSDVHFISIK